MWACFQNSEILNPDANVTNRYVKTLRSNGDIHSLSILRMFHFYETGSGTSLILAINPTTSSKPTILSDLDICKDAFNN